MTNMTMPKNLKSTPYAALLTTLTSISPQHLTEEMLLTFLKAGLTVTNTRPAQVKKALARLTALLEQEGLING